MMSKCWLNAKEIPNPRLCGSSDICKLCVDQVIPGLGLFLLVLVSSL